MNWRFLSSLLFFLLAFQTNAMDEIDSKNDSDKNRHNLSTPKPDKGKELATEKELEADEDLEKNQRRKRKKSQAPRRNKAKGEGKGKKHPDETVGCSSSSSNSGVEEQDSRQSYGREGRDLTISPFNDRQNDRQLDAYINETIFPQNDSASHETSKWDTLMWLGLRGPSVLGWLVGAVADPAMIPMALYVLSKVLGIPPDSLCDILFMVGLGLYVYIPSTENMTRAGENIAEWGDNLVKWWFSTTQPQIPKAYDVRKTSSSSSLRNFFTHWDSILLNPIVLNGLSHFHAFGTTLILTNIFCQIEHHDLLPLAVTVVPYALNIYAKNISFFRQGHNEAIKWRRHWSEMEGDRGHRTTLRNGLKRFKEVRLPNLSREDLDDIYTLLINQNFSAFDKIRRLYEHSNPLSIQEESAPMLARNREQNRDLTILESNTYRTRSGGKFIAKSLGRFIFGATLLSEYYLCQYGLNLFCENMGLDFVLAQDWLTVQGIIRYGGAGTLTAASLLEYANIKQYYESIFYHSFGSLYSESNQIMRRGIGIIAFPAGFGLALSEVYPAVQELLHEGAGPVISYPLFVLMIVRHQARNAFWLQEGYDHFLSRYHQGGFWRYILCCCLPWCSQQRKIDIISDRINRLLDLIDLLNPEGIEALYAAYFNHDPV